MKLPDLTELALRNLRESVLRNSLTTVGIAVGVASLVAMLSLAILFPPWETPPSQAPEFLGLHFILSPPTPDAIVSRLLLTIELVTIAIAGLYGSFLFRQKP